MSVCDDKARCDYCKTKPRWIYRVGDEEICGACCANRLAEARAENAKLREANDEAKALLREVTDKWDVKSWSNYDEQSIRLMRYWFNRAKALLLKESL